MSAEDDDEFEDDAPSGIPGDGEFSGEGDGGGEDGGAAASGFSFRRIRDWMTSRRGWVMIAALAAVQAVFAVVVIHLRSEAKPIAEIRTQTIRDLATELLGYEVKVNQIYQLIPVRGGKRLTVGLDLVLVLGQLPEEQVEGAPRPNPEEMALFVETIKTMEPGVRSMVNILLQQIPADDLGSAGSYETIKSAVRKYVNDTLNGLDFGSGLRPDIGKRRVTDVLLPMFVKQYM